MQLVNSKCPSCGLVLKVNEQTGTAICDYCGNEYVVEKDVTTSKSSDNATSNITDNKSIEPLYDDKTLVINGKRILTTNNNANSCEWSFSIGNKNYNVLFEKRKFISVNGEDAIKIAKLKSKESNILETVHDVDLGDGKVAKLCMRKKEFTLVYDGKNLENGRPYEITDVPKWAFVFEVLYIVNFFLIMGGAVGACVSLIGAVVSATIASNKKMNNVAKVLASVALYAVLTVISFFVASSVAATLRK